MLTKHITRHLSSYHHGELSPEVKLSVETHLSQCSKCQTAYDEIRLGASLAAMLSPSSAPDSIWREIHRTRGTRPQPQWMGTAFAASFAIVLAFAGGLLLYHSVWEVPSWEVAINGTSRRLRAGESLQTDGASEAQLKIANIGQLTLDPNTRIRLLVTKSDQHRISLERGRVEARTWAPPRLFIVDTPSATAIDLGCMYTLNVEEDGSSLLHVTLGLVALELRGRETVVPAGAFCRTRPGAGPGAPYFEDASPQLQSALEYLDLGKDGPESMRQLQIILRESRIRDALTLWHLLPRLDRPSRGLIYDRLASLIPPPPEVTRDGILALDASMLARWKPLVAQLWE